MDLLFAALLEISVKETAPKNKIRIIYLPCVSAPEALILAGDGSVPLCQALEGFAGLSQAPP